MSGTTPKTPTPVALVTGASRGIGRGIALQLAGEGFNLIINYARNADAAEEVRGKCEAAGVKALAIQADIANSADRKKLCEDSFAAFGRIDLLVNNAGIAPPVRADILDASEESFDAVINTNLKGPYFLTQLIAKRMIPQGGGKIVNITSVSAEVPSINRGDYCVAKAGLAMMTKLFAARLAEHGVNVYEIRPGIIETDMTGPVKAKYDKLILQDGIQPIRRWGTPEDVAKAVAAIAKNLLPFSTGEVIHVDGGFHVQRL
jgi:NAD(P)-dependent dehydrogenase (short-subunit alcohol dehydrogenase family)